MRWLLFQFQPLVGKDSQRYLVGSDPMGDVPSGQPREEIITKTNQNMDISFGPEKINTKIELQTNMRFVMGIGYRVEKDHSSHRVTRNNSLTQPPISRSPRSIRVHRPGPLPRPNHHPGERYRWIRQEDRTK